MSTKSNILLVGSGGVGTMAAYNLEIGKLATVTSVLRSNYSAVLEHGFAITSLDHGNIKGWRPSHIRQSVPDVGKDNLKPFDYIVVTTKNIPDIPPSVADIIAPAVTPGHTTIVLLQNGLNIERPLIAAFPTNVVLSGVSLIGATETSPGNIVHDDHDRLTIGPFNNPTIPKSTLLSASTHFTTLYSASGVVTCAHDPNVSYIRWRKLIYNASYNPICAIAGMDTARMRIYGSPIQEVIRPLMWEIWNVARVAGVMLATEVVEDMIAADPMDTFFKPSMMQDIEKGNYTEFENIVGEPLREAERLGVYAPNLKMVYGLCKILQLKVKEQKGLVTLPLRDDPIERKP